MRKKIYIIIAILTTLFVMPDCDKIEEPFFEDGVTVWNGRKILIYDFTGHKCGNCPRAHKLLENFKSRYGDAVVPIAIHATFFAMPQDQADGKFSYDFRTDIGDILGGRGLSTDCYYGELYLPTGLVNNLSKNALMSDNQWAEQVEKYLPLFPEFEIRIKNSYCPQEKSIITEINIETLIENNRNLHLNVFVTEDEIKQWQEDYLQTPSAIENYVHNHVLRGGFVGAFGEAVNENNNSLNIGKTIRKEYSLVMEKDWVKENCSVIAFVYDYDNKEVMQTEIKKFP